MAAGAKDIDIRLQIRANSKEGKCALDDFRRMMGEDVPDAAGKAQKSIGALQVALGSLIADGVKAAGSALKDFAAESVGAFLDFEKVMTGVAKTTGLPKQEVQELGKELRNIAAEIGPIMATDIGEIAEVAGQLGIASEKIKTENFAAAREEISAFATTIGKAAIALPEFEGGAEQVATVIAKQLALYQANTDAAEVYLSTMNALANTTAANAAQIAGFLEGFTIAPQLKITQDQAAALGATFISLGQDAHDSATRIQSAYATIMKGSDATDSALKAIFTSSQESLAALNEIAGTSLTGKEKLVEFGNAIRKALGEDAVGATTLLADALARVEEPEHRMSLAFDAFGRVGARTLSTLIGNTERLTTNLNIARDAAEANTSIQQEFQTAISTQGAKFEELKSKVADVQIEVGTHLTSALAAVVDTDINPLIDDFRTWMTTSEDARVLFQETLPQAIQLTVSAVRTVGAALITIKNGIEIWGDAAGMIIGQVQEGWEQFERSVGAAGTKIGEAVGTVEEKVENLVTGFNNLKDQVTAAVNAVIEKIRAIPQAIEDAAEAVKNYGEAASDAVFQNEKAIGVFQKLTDKIYGVEHALEGGSLTPAMRRYTNAAEEAEISTSGFEGELAAAETTVKRLDAVIEDLGDDLQVIAKNFQIKGLGDIGSGISQLPDVFNNLKSSMSGIPESLGAMQSGFGSLVSGNILSGLGGLVTGIGGITSAIGALSAAWSIGKKVWGGIKSLFSGFGGKSEGNKAAAAMREFVKENIEGGEKVSAAMKNTFNEFKAAGNNYATFMQRTNIAALVQESFGGFSQNWQEGTSAIDIFAQAVGRATGNMEKAPQVALQMIAAMQESGMSAQDISAKMIEVAQAAGLSESQIAALTATLGGLQGSSSDAASDLTLLSQIEDQTSNATQSLSQAALQTSGAIDQVSGAAQTGQGFLTALGDSALLAGNIGTENMGLLSQAYLDQVPKIQKAHDAAEQLNKMIRDIPTEINIQPHFLKWTGNAPPGMASGGKTLGSPVIVGERGPEGAIFPGGGRGIVGLEGSELQLFPAGTQIIPNTQLSSFIKALPHMAGGGTVEPLPFIGNLTINVYPARNKDYDERRLAEYVMQEIARKIRPYMR